LHRAARVHHAYRRRGGVAAHGKCAAGGDAGKSETNEVLMEKGFAERFAKEWVAAWNSHDLERILALSSPIITALVGEPSGRLRGKTAVGAYWAKALQSIPNLRFELLTALAGVNSITVYYSGHRGLAAEVLHFGPSGKVREAFAHYAE
jgi:SnoaL-like domain/ABC transporter substrate binding protein